MSNTDTAEAPHCPVYVDGQKFTTIRGSHEELAGVFLRVVDDYVCATYGNKKEPAPSRG